MVAFILARIAVFIHGKARALESRCPRCGEFPPPGSRNQKSVVRAGFVWRFCAQCWAEWSRE